MRSIFIGSAVVGLLTLTTATAHAGDLAIVSAPKSSVQTSSVPSLQLCTPVGMGMLHLPSVLTCFQMGSTPSALTQGSFSFSPSITGMVNGLAAAPRANDPTTGWNLTAFMSHQWTDRLRSEIGVRHMQLDVTRSDSLRVTDGQVTAASAGVSYSFFRGFDIGLEFQYANLKSRFGSVSVAAPHPGATGEERNISTRLRVDRAF